MSLLIQRSVTALLVAAAAAGCDTDKGTNPKDESSRKVAIYSGRGCWAESITAARKMFEWMGCTVELVSASRINAEGLAGFGAVFIPGGDMYLYAQDISSTGKARIRSFVRGGGGYIGICGGAYFASARVVWRSGQLDMEPLGIFMGTASGPVDEIAPYPDYGMCTVNIVDQSHPVTKAEPASERILYYWGPTLAPDTGVEVSILGRYEGVDEPAIVAFGYGEGRVFLVGTHPEIEEDSNRDGVDFGDELDDQGSEWDLMKQATLWCLKRIN